MFGHQVTTGCIHEEVTVETHQSQSGRGGLKFSISNRKYSRFNVLSITHELTLMGMDSCYNPFSEVFFWYYEIWKRHNE